MPKSTKGATGNGNKFKGNKNKKRKNFEAELDEDEDYYGLVIEKTGGNRLKILPMNANEEDTISAMIPGRMIKKCWFNVGDIAVITGNKQNGDVIKGRVLSKLESKIKTQLSNSKKSADNNDVLDFDSLFDKDDKLGDNDKDKDDKEEDFDGEIDFDIV